MELGHLQQAREFLDEIRQDLIGGRGVTGHCILAMGKGPKKSSGDR